MTEQELIEEAQKLIRRYDNLRIVGSRGEWSGNVRQGFMFNPQKGGGSSGGGGVTPATGACCLDDGTCEVVTLGQCLLDGGTYQGDGTTCDTTGACCLPDSSCIITTEDCCNNAGGTYQGDSTVCDPNPCALPPCCPGAFTAFDGSGRKFLTQTITTSGNAQFDPPPGCTGNATVSWSSTTVQTFDPDTCVETCTCTGSGTFNVPWVGAGCTPCSGTMTAASCGGTANPCGATPSILIDSSGSLCHWTVSTDCTGGPANIAFACFSCSPTTSVDSATQETLTWNCTIGTQFVMATAVYTLSDECTP